MDREDARFVANALDCRISGARGELEQLAASSLMVLSAIAATITKRNSGLEPWSAATVAAEELMEICRKGGNVVDQPLDLARKAELKEFVASMRRLAGETQAPRNRAERRAAAKILLPRSKRLIRAGAMAIANLGRIH